MPPPVEAQSLSSLIQIASNPPRYPRNPTEPKRDPLVLYIARVPGVQDIILTPLKPDLKNLKEIDVASCLYYLHRDLPSDAALLDQDQTQDSISNYQPPAPPLPQIARKPLPELSAVAIAEREATNLATLQSLNEARTSYLASPPTPSPPSRSPSPPPKPPRRPLDFQPAPPPSLPPRRPLGPRPLSIDPGALLSRLPLRGSENQNDPPPPPRPSPATATAAASATTIARSRANSLFPPLLSPSSSSPPRPSEPYSITLIRRDPSTASQWTIGRIHITPNANPPITIHLTTPGYLSFTTPPSEVFTRTINTPPPSRPRTSFHLNPTHNHRHGYNKYKHTRTRSAIPTTSTTTIPSTTTTPQTSSLITLTTPWNTPCAFTTSPSGRSLHCTHFLPGDSSSSSSLAAGTTGGTPVSELRYNTPAHSHTNQSTTTTTTSSFWRPRPRSAPSSPSPYTSAYTPSTTKITNPSLSNSPSPYTTTNPSLSTNTTTTPPPTDLTLGREKAGGGRTGGRAKLGKLIVFGEGIKMLDLVVAGNMGVWWERWEGGG